jgi:hypothetical protein
MSCRWCTSFCANTCYNRKIYACYKGMESADERYEREWLSLSGMDWARILDRKKRSTQRVRLMTRGEAFSTAADVDRVRDILAWNPGRLVWIPTRVWRGPLRDAVRRLSYLSNARIMASIDPSNNDDEIDTLKADGWSTLFFGDDDDVRGRIKCPKTWQGVHGACASCTVGCFRSRQVHVHLKEH